MLSTMYHSIQIMRLRGWAVDAFYNFNKLCSPLYPADANFDVTCNPSLSHDNKGAGG